MIFTYTPKEQERIAILEAEHENALEAFVETKAIEIKYGIDSPQFKKAHAEAVKRLTDIDQRFEELINELDAARFKKLKTPQAILKDAKKQTQDAIIYSFMRLELVTHLCLAEPDKTTKWPLIPGKDMNFSGIATIYTWRSLSKEFRKRKQPRAFNNGCIYEAGTVLLNEISTINFIKGTVLKKHIAALKGLPEADQLESYVLQAATESPYITNFNTFNLATHDAIFNGNTWDKIAPITSSSILSNPFVAMYHSKPTDRLTQLNYRDAEFDPINGKAKIISGGLTIVFEDYQLIKGKRNINEVKLLNVAMAEFTKQNNYSKRNKKATNYRVSIPLDEYLIACGYNIEEKETNTPEEAAKEQKRAAYARKDGRKKLRKSLEVLSSQSLEWNEGPIGSADKNFAVTSMISGYSIKNGYILITISPDFGDLLMQSPLTQYPTALLAIDERNPNAYRIGYVMTTHYNKDTNQIIGTANRLKAETLLKHTDLPTITTVQKQRKSWQERIKEPLEVALDELTKKEVLEDWEYTRAKGVKLADAEAMQITDYETFKDLYITYKLKDAPDHTARLARRAKEKEENQQRKKATKRKK